MKKLEIDNIISKRQNDRKEFEKETTIAYKEVKSHRPMYRKIV